MPEYSRHNGKLYRVYPHGTVYREEVTVFYADGLPAAPATWTRVPWSEGRQIAAIAARRVA